MRSVPKFLSILVLVCWMGLASADEPQTDVSERLEKLGHPLAQRYPDGNVYVSGIAKSGELKVYRFNGNGFDPCTGDLLPGAEQPVRNSVSWSTAALEKPTIFKGKTVYLGGVIRSNQDADKRGLSKKALELFVATLPGPNEFRAERSLTEENLTDLAVDDERCYTVRYRWKNQSDPKQGAVTTVSASTDLKNWSKLFSFHDETFASAIEVVNGDFYLGLGGTREFWTPYTGMVRRQEVGPLAPARWSECGGP